ncbi:Serine/threonine protein kinase [Hyalangium minutum]|uniref:Serine/threonine protein kinase n=1 Tax=Hyalangium minutum TaxID=394096 RepID=A0A085WGT5_9BACT|nr:Serine/threonine protein kinase [Hyalangium minutum]
MTAPVVGLPPGAVIDGFKVLKALGDGGFAFVYLVEKDGQLYALKLARHRQASGDDRRTHARTLRELGIRISSPIPVEGRRSSRAAGQGRASVSRSLEEE